MNYTKKSKKLQQEILAELRNKFQLGSIKSRTNSSLGPYQVNYTVHVDFPVKGNRRVIAYLLEKGWSVERRYRLSRPVFDRVNKLHETYTKIEMKIVADTEHDGYAGRKL